jgi:hypothetical protein
MTTHAEQLAWFDHGRRVGHTVAEVIARASQQMDEADGRARWSVARARAAGVRVARH